MKVLSTIRRFFASPFGTGVLAGVALACSLDLLIDPPRWTVKVRISADDPALAVFPTAHQR